MKKREIKCSFYNLIKINPNQKIIKRLRLEILITYKIVDDDLTFFDIFKDRIDLYFRMSNL